MKTRLLFLLLAVFSFGNAQNVITNLSSQTTSPTSANITFFIQNNCVNGYYTVQLSSSSFFSSPFYSATTAITDCSASPIQKTVAVTGLASNATYYYRVIAGPSTNPAANPDYSSSASLSTSITIPSLNHQNITSTTAEVVYSIQNNCSSVDYQVQYSTASSFAGPLYSTVSNMTNCSATATQQSTTLSGLTIGTTYYYRIMARYGTAGTWVYSTTSSFVAGQINIGSLAHQNVQHNSAEINFTVQNNCSLVYYKVQYSKFSTFANSLYSTQESTSSCVGNLTSQVQNLTALSSNTIYYYKLLVSYSASGPWTTSATQNFTTTADPSGLIQEWKFDNSRTNESNNLTFPDNGFSGFVVDRNGVASSALSLSDRGTSVAIPNIPLNSNPRTVSIWVKMSGFQTSPNNSYVFGYGGITTNTAYGFAFQSSAGFIIANNFGWGNDASAIVSNSVSTWHHVATVYDGVNAKIYFDGALVTSLAKSWLTSGTNANFFRIGQSTNGTNTFSGVVDDLKIYDRALTAAQISSLYTTNTLTSENFNANNLEVGLYPNPVNDILNIDTNEEILSVEVFALQGQKVLSSKQNKINVAELPAGIYLVRIEDVNNNIATKKIIKN